MVAAGGATVVQLRDKVQRHRASMIALARAIKAALGRRAADHQRPRRRRARGGRRRRASRPGRHERRRAREILGPAPFIGLIDQDGGAGARGAARLIDYVGIGGVFGTTSKQNVIRRSDRRGSRASSAYFASGSAISRPAASPGSTRRTPAGDRGGRRRRVGDLGAVAGARSDRRRRDCAPSSMRRWQVRRRRRGRRPGEMGNA